MRAGRPPTWPTYNFGLRLLETIEHARDALTPPDLRALELSYAFIDTAIVHQVTALGALDAFSRGAEAGDAGGVCLRAEEIALASPVAAHAPYLYRLLRAAATRNLLEWHPERDDCFTLTPLGACFQRFVGCRWVCLAMLLEPASTLDGRPRLTHPHPTSEPPTADSPSTRWRAGTTAGRWTLSSRDFRRG